MLPCCTALAIPSRCCDVEARRSTARIWRTHKAKSWVHDPGLEEVSVLRIKQGKADLLTERCEKRCARDLGTPCYRGAREGREHCRVFDPATTLLAPANLPAESDGSAPSLVDEGHERLVHPAAEDHLYNLRGNPAWAFERFVGICEKGASPHACPSGSSARGRLNAALQ